jgi:glyoxylase-like metal-dependent hydrolase (beta-lactamase superfamily II)
VSRLPVVEPPSLVVPGVWRIELGVVNAYLAETDAGTVLIDAGSPGDGTRLAAALAHIGVAPSEITAVVATHHHPDHAGGLAEALALTGAEAWMHPLDATEVRAGNGFRSYRAASGLLNRVLERIVVRPVSPVIPPAVVAHEVEDGDALPGGLVAIHAPGHSAGQIAVWWPDRRVLFAADACSTLPVLGYSVVYEDLAEGKRSLRKLAALGAETAVFGHGRPIVRGAARRLADRFGSD